MYVFATNETSDLKQNISRTNFIKKNYIYQVTLDIYPSFINDHISERSVSYWHMIYLASIWKIHQFLPKEPRQWIIF